MSPDESREFEWLQDAGDVVIQAQPAVAVNTGPAGVVIRRQADEFDEMYGHGDILISFSIEHAPAIAAAILEAAGLDATALDPEPTLRRTKAKDPTAAGRQRRHRERKKKESTPEPDIFDRDVARDTVTRDGSAT